MTNEETLTVIGDAFLFARNILAAVVIDMQEQGVPDERIETLLTKVDELNEELLKPMGRAVASEQMAVMLAGLRATRGTD